MKKILVLHGPNLNLLSLRETSVYGNVSLEHINTTLQREAQTLGFSLTSHQSNCEGALIDSIHQAYQERVDYLIMNPAAYTHTSIALRDALLATQIPFIEVHLSLPQAREPFRHHSYFSDIAQGVISGFGAHGYTLALRAISLKFN